MPFKFISSVKSWHKPNQCIEVLAQQICKSLVVRRKINLSVVTIRAWAGALPREYNWEHLEVVPQPPRKTSGMGISLTLEAAGSLFL